MRLSSHSFYTPREPTGGENALFSRGMRNVRSAYDARPKLSSGLTGQSLLSKPLENFHSHSPDSASGGSNKQAVQSVSVSQHPFFMLSGPGFGPGGMHLGNIKLRHGLSTNKQIVDAIHVNKESKMFQKAGGSIKINISCDTGGRISPIQGGALKTWTSLDMSTSETPLFHNGRVDVATLLPKHKSRTKHLFSESPFESEHCTIVTNSASNVNDACEAPAALLASSQERKELHGVHVHSTAGSTEKHCRDTGLHGGKIQKPHGHSSDRILSGHPGLAHHVAKLDALEERGRGAVERGLAGGIGFGGGARLKFSDTAEFAQRSLSREGIQSRPTTQVTPTAFQESHSLCGSPWSLPSQMKSFRLPEKLNSNPQHKLMDGLGVHHSINALDHTCAPSICRQAVDHVAHMSVDARVAAIMSPVRELSKVGMSKSRVHQQLLSRSSECRSLSEFACVQPRKVKGPIMGNKPDQSMQTIPPGHKHEFLRKFSPEFRDYKFSAALEACQTETCKDPMITGNWPSVTPESCAAGKTSVMQDDGWQRSDQSLNCDRYNQDSAVFDGLKAEQKDCSEQHTLYHKMLNSEAKTCMSSIQVEHTVQEASQEALQEAFHTTGTHFYEQGLVMAETQSEQSKMKQGDLHTVENDATAKPEALEHVLDTLLEIQSEVKVINDRLDHEVRVHQAGTEAYEEMAEASFAALRAELNEEGSKCQNGFTSLTETVQAFKMQLEKEARERTKGDEVAPQLITRAQQQITHCLEELTEERNLRAEDSTKFCQSLQGLTSLTETVQAFKVQLEKETCERIKGDEVAPLQITRAQQQITHCLEVLTEERNLRLEDSTHFRQSLQGFNTQFTQQIDDLRSSLTGFVSQEQAECSTTHVHNPPEYCELPQTPEKYSTLSVSSTTSGSSRNGSEDFGSSSSLMSSRSMLSPSIDSPKSLFSTGSTMHADTNGCSITVYSPARKISMKQEIEAGDLVAIVPEAPDYNCVAVVTNVFKKHCTVVVLDQTLCFAAGELSPSFHDIMLLSSHWRLGTEVIVSGLGSSTLQHLNGSSGTIVRPPEQTHPLFVQRSNEEMPCLLLYVKVQTGDSKECVMVEPKYLMTCSTPVATKLDIDNLSRRGGFLSSTSGVLKSLLPCCQGCQVPLRHHSTQK